MKKMKLNKILMNFVILAMRSFNIESAAVCMLSTILGLCFREFKMRRSETQKFRTFNHFI